MSDRKIDAIDDLEIEIVEAGLEAWKANRIEGGSKLSSMACAWRAMTRWAQAEGDKGGDDKRVWMIVFEDAQVLPKTFSGYGAEQAAWRAFEHFHINWNCTLLVSIAGPLAAGRYAPPAPSPRPCDGADGTEDK